MARLEWVAVGWGGLVAAVGLLAGSAHDLALRLLALALAFAVGGFLAGIRASGERPAHATGAWFVAYAIGAAFLILAALVHLFGGPSPPSVAPGGARASLIGAVWALAWALVGGYVAAAWLRPAVTQRRRA